MKSWIRIIGFFVSAQCLHAQEVEFSQFFSSSVYLNPAFIGLEPEPYVNVNYSSTGQVANGSVRTISSFTVGYPIQNLTSISSQAAGFGLSMINQRRGFGGIYESLHVLGTGGYVLQLDVEGKRRIIFGLQAGIMRHQVNLSELQFGSQYNPYIGFDNSLSGEEIRLESTTNPIFNFGVAYTFTDHKLAMLSRKSLTVGFSAHSLNRPQEGFINNGKRPITYKSVLTSRLRLSPQYFIHPSALFLFSSSTNQVNAGMYFSRYVGPDYAVLLQLGTWYRVRDSFIFLGGIDFRNYRFGFSIDLNAAAFNPNNALVDQGVRSAFEISLKYTLRKGIISKSVNNPMF